MIPKAVMLYFWFGSVIRLKGVDKRRINSSGTVDSAEMSIIYGTKKNHWCAWPYQVATSLPDVEVGLSLSTNVS